MKKAMDVSPTSIIVGIALLLFVLVLLFFILGGQTQDFLRILTGYKTEFVENKCSSIIFSRQCGCPTTDVDKYNCEPAPPPTKGSWDCSNCMVVTNR